MSDPYYWGATKADGVCDLCGKNGLEHIKKRGKIYAVRQYHKIWEKVTWFRGDDEIAGTVCTDCKKEKSLPEIMELKPGHLTRENNQ